jgi:mannose-6-phosphate isomerase-like protein (cupin superfamily)
VVVRVTLAGRGYMVGRGTGRPTRVDLPDTSFKALTTDTGGAYTFGEHELVHEFPLHVHDREDEAVYMLQGRVGIVVGEDSFLLEPGDFVFMPRGVAHSITGASDPPVRFLFISTPGGFEHFMEGRAELLAAGRRASSSEWRELLAKHALRLL